MLPEILRLTKSFISIPSTKDNTVALHDVITLCKDELQEYRFEEFSYRGVPSILFFNTDTRPERFRMLLNGHLDVVPASIGQAMAFIPYEQGGRLYGRGAYDMKAATAIELLVFKYLAKKLSYPIGLQLSLDEEIGGFRSTGHQVAQGVRTSFVLIGEPTDFAINTEQKGVYLVRLNTKTKGSAHAAYLWNGQNAIVEGAKFIDRLLSIYPVPQEEVWRTTASVSEISTSNSAHNMTPEDCSILVDIRFVPEETIEDIHELLTSISPPGTEIVVVAHGESAYTQRTHPDVNALAQSIQAITGVNASFHRMHGSSDMRHHTKYGAGGVKVGVKGYGLHTAEEYVEIESLQAYADILTNFLESIR